MSKKNTLDISNGWYKFLLTLSDTLSPIQNSEEIMFKAVSLLGNYLGVERAFYCDMDTDGDNMWIRRDYVNNVESQKGYCHISDFDPFLLNEYRAGRTVVMDDAAVDTRLSKDERLKYSTVDKRSFVGVPLMKEDKLMSVLTVNQSTPRKWTEAEISIIEETAERTWAAVERAKAEGRIKESESLFRTMADSSPVLIWTIDSNGLSSYYNKTFRDFIGVTEDEDISDWQKIVHPDDVQSTLDTINTAIAERRSYSIECRLLRADGQWRWLLVQGNPSVGANNEFLGFVGSSVDITDRKQAEERIKESEAFSWSTLESSPDCVKVINTEGRVTYMNFNGLCTLEIDDFSEIKNKSWWSLWGKENEQTVKAAIAKSLNGETSQFQAMCPTAKGTNKWWDVLVSPVETPDGKISQLISVSRDITSQVEQRKEIDDSESLFRLALFLTAQTVFKQDKQLRYTWIYNTHPKFVDQELIGKIDSEILGKDAAEILTSIKQSVLNTGKTFTGNIQFEIEGQLMVFSARIEATKDIAGQINGIIAVTDDITERKQAENKIKESEQEIRKIKEQLELSIRAGKIGVWHWDVNQDTLYWSEEQKVIYGLEPSAELLNVAQYRALVVPEDWERLNKVLQSVPLSDEQEYDFRIIRKNDGEIRWIKSRARNILDPQGAIQFISGVNIDVTEQVIALTKLQASEEKFKRLVLQAPVAICVLRGKDYVIETMNDGMCALWDRTSAQALNKPVFDVLPEVKDQGIKELLDNVYFTGERCVIQELSVNIRRNDKLENAFVKFVYEPLREADGTISGVMALAHEITEEVMARKKVEESEKRFEAAILAVISRLWMG